jgi:hypothetical protein
MITTDELPRELLKAGRRFKRLVWNGAGLGRRLIGTRTVREATYRHWFVSAHEPAYETGLAVRVSCVTFIHVAVVSFTVLERKLPSDPGVGTELRWTFEPGRLGYRVWPAYVKGETWADVLRLADIATAWGQSREYGWFGWPRKRRDFGFERDWAIDAIPASAL